MFTVTLLCIHFEQEVIWVQSQQLYHANGFLRLCRQFEIVHFLLKFKVNTGTVGLQGQQGPCACWNKLRVCRLLVPQVAAVPAGGDATASSPSGPPYIVLLCWCTLSSTCAPFLTGCLGKKKKKKAQLSIYLMYDMLVNMLFTTVSTWLFNLSCIVRAHQGRHYQMPAKGGADSVGLLLEKLCNNNSTASNSAHLFFETLIDYRCVRLLLTQAARLENPTTPLSSFSSIASLSSCSFKHTQFWT